MVSLVPEFSNVVTFAPADLFTKGGKGWERFCRGTLALKIMQSQQESTSVLMAMSEYKNTPVYLVRVPDAEFIVRAGTLMWNDPMLSVTFAAVFLQPCDANIVLANLLKMKSFLAPGHGATGVPQFWASVCGLVETAEIQRVCDALVQQNSALEPLLPVLRGLLGSASGTTVSMAAFARLVGWFGPVSDLAANLVRDLPAMSSFATKPWFFGFADNVREIVVALASQKPVEEPVLIACADKRNQFSVFTSNGQSNVITVMQQRDPDTSGHNYCQYNSTFDVAQPPVAAVDLATYQIKWHAEKGVFLRDEERVGRGAFAGVYKTKLRQQDTVACIKFEGDSLAAPIVSALRAQVPLLAKLQHPNVVRFRGAVFDYPVAMVTEFLENHSLYEMLHATGPDGKLVHNLSVAQRVRLLADAATGMQYLHSQGIVHRDLNTRTLLVTSDMQCKVADVALSRLKAVVHKLTGDVVSPATMAPELVRGDFVKNPTMIDVYSFGVIMWEVITGRVPFDGVHPVEILFTTAHGVNPLEAPPSCPPAYAALMRQCLSAVPAARPTFEKIHAELVRMVPS